MGRGSYPSSSGRSSPRTLNSGGLLAQPREEAPHLKTQFDDLIQLLDLETEPSELRVSEALELVPGTS